MTDDMEWLNRNNPEQPPAARPQHLRFARSLMEQKDSSEMTSKMPDIWLKLFHTIQEGSDTWQGKPILRSDVNKIIEELKKCQPKPRQQTYQTSFAEQAGRPPQAPRDQFAPPRTAQNLEDGMYRRPKDGVIFKLYHTVHGANVQVAKQLIVVDAGERATPNSFRDGLTSSIDQVWIRPPVVRFEYKARKPLYTLKPEMRLTIEEARKFGALYGTCCICGRTLTNELSIHLGIGPVCGDREFGGDFEFLLAEAGEQLNKQKQESLDAFGAQLLDDINSGRRHLSEVWNDDIKDLDDDAM
jgi:hypothetical protein